MKKDYSSPLPKRFYKDVTTREEGGKWSVLLDGRMLRTVGKHVLHVPNADLAEAVAQEWRLAGTHINPHLMPLTRLANIMIDRMPKERAAIMDSLQLYAETDLLCYRASESELRAKQNAQWDAVLQALEPFSIRMVTVTGVIPALQPASSLQAIRDLMGEANDAEAAALAMMVPLLGSVLLALALWKQCIGVEAAIAACRLDEDFQQSRWGVDAEADALWQAKLRDLNACAEWLSSLVATA